MAGWDGDKMAETLNIDKDLADALSGVVGASLDGYTVVADEQVDERRWVAIHLLTIKDADGNFWQHDYERGLTENCDDYGFGYGVDPVPFWRVVAREKVITEYVQP
jgi:hypothetical protein